MTASELDRTLCPLCQQPNACGAAAGSDTCWCMSVTLSKEALERIPPAARGEICICRRCGVPLDGEQVALPD